MVRSNQYGWRLQQRQFEVCDGLDYENEGRKMFRKGWYYDSQWIASTKKLCMMGYFLL